MNKILIAAASALILATPSMVLAADDMAGMKHEMHEHSSAAMSEGVVKKLDKAAGKLTLAHGPLQNLDMPAMTMVFKSKDPACLDKLKVGDKIRFVAEDIKGELTVTRCERVK